MITKLSEICDFLSGNAWKAASFQDSGMPIIRINNMNFNDNDFVYWQDVYDKKYLINKGDLLLSLSGTIKTFKWNGPEALLNQRIVKITAKENLNVNINWIYYQLHYAIEIIANKGKHAVIRNVSVNDLKAFEVDLPDIQTQNKIVAILDKASSLVRKREESIKMLDEVLRATFLDMFGDPTISRKYEIGNLTNYISRIQIGPFGSQLHQADYIEGGIPLINPINIIENKIGPDLSITIKKEKYNSLPNYHLVEGDIIMARRGEMGRCGLITKKEDGFFCGTGSLFVRPNKETDSTFLLYCLTNEGVIKYLNNSAKGITMKNLNKSILQNVPLINVPFSDQKIFKNKVDTIEKTLNACLASIAELNLLFKSILQKVFNGQLNFNVDFELDALIREIDLQKKENDLSKIAGDIAYLQRLIDKLNNQEFKEKDLYDKAKHGAFQLMAVKEEERKVVQKYDENSKSLKLALK